MIGCAISLGGNLGDVHATFDRACRQLASHPEVSDFAVSRNYRTAPMGSSAGEAFLNAAAVFETTLPPEQLLDVLQQLELDCGRVRGVHWGSRTLDLDLLLYGERTVDSPCLHIPHPAFWHRRFVLDPLCELVPAARHPVFELTMHELRARLLPRPLPVCFTPGPCSAAAHSFLSVGTDRYVSATEPGSAAIIFAAGDNEIPWPQVVRLPAEEMAAAQTVTDVLTAALDEPVAVD